MNSKLPQPVEPSEDLDAYEAEYMGGGGAVVLHTKTRTNWSAMVSAGAMSIFVTVWCATHPGLGLNLGLGLGVGILLLGLSFAVLRVRVTTASVDIDYGMFGPKIPLDAIESVEAVVHGHRSALRWGVSPLGKGAWLYSIAGDEGRAVKIVWRGPKGQRCVHYIGSPEHELLATAIESARQKRALNEAPGELAPAPAPESE